MSDEQVVYVVYRYDTGGEEAVLAVYRSLAEAQRQHGWGWREVRDGLWRWSNYEEPRHGAYIARRAVN